MLLLRLHIPCLVTDFMRGKVSCISRLICMYGPLRAVENIIILISMYTRAPLSNIYYNLYICISMLKYCCNSSRVHLKILSIFF